MITDYNMTTKRRIRASTPRAKTGCSICRQRHVKCDETRPACQRCLRSGWSCPGYTNRPPPQMAVECSKRAIGTALPVHRRPDASSASISEYSIPFKVPGSQGERKALHYFANFAAPALGGYLPSAFWSRTILQRCQHDAVVRRAASALGRAHLEYTTCQDPSSFCVSTETLEAHTRALKCLRNYLGKQSCLDEPVILMCSAAFTCFELLRGDQGVALKHLQSGMKIVKRWQEDSVAKSSKVVDSQNELMSAFMRLDVQATMFDDGRLPTLRFNDEKPTLLTGLADAEAEAPAFETVQAAQDALFELVHTMFVYLVENARFKFAEPSVVPAMVKAGRVELVRRFDRWRRRLRLIEEGKVDTHITDNDTKALLVCKLYWQCGKLLVLHSLEHDLSAISPSFDDNAEALLNLARAIIHETADANGLEKQGCNPVGTRQHCFSLHPGVVIPLSLLALKTTDSNVRKSAVELLNGVGGRREGFHDATAMAKLLGELETKNAVMGRLDTDSLMAKRDTDGPEKRPLEWVVDPVMNPWEDDVERLNGLEKLMVRVSI